MLDISPSLQKFRNIFFSRPFRKTLKENDYLAFKLFLFFIDLLGQSLLDRKSFNSRYLIEG
jgi:hypothetical protein